MTETRYQQALDYLYSFVDYSLKKADVLAAANFDLARMRAFLAALGNPQEQYPTIHVAGTKGKGSISALCASALQAGGRKTGLYTSPHLLDFTERIQVNNLPIHPQDLADLVDEIKPVVASIEALTTFELTTALGFLYFARQKVDAAVIEVGLGGRLDATNVIHPLVSVISSISYDHTAVLGNTLAKIAAEKGGIIKPGVPVVLAPQKTEALEMLAMLAVERHSPLHMVGIDCLYEIGKHSLNEQEVFVWEPGLPKTRLQIPLLGRHQAQNAATAYAALHASHLGLPEKAILEGFASAKWQCRFEIAHPQNPTLVFDSAHNEDSFLRLAETLRDYYPERKVILLFGASEDKHIADMLKAMEGIISRLILARANHPRALGVDALLEAAKQAGLQAVSSAESVPAALNLAISLSEQTGDLILSAGSMFLTAEVKQAWMDRNSPITR